MSRICPSPVHHVLNGFVCSSHKSAKVPPLLEVRVHQETSTPPRTQKEPTPHFPRARSECTNKQRDKSIVCCSGCPPVRLRPLVLFAHHHMAAKPSELCRMWLPARPQRRGADRRTRKARRRRMILPGMGRASDSSDMDTAAAAGASGEDGSPGGKLAARLRFGGAEISGTPAINKSARQGSLGKCVRTIKDIHL